MCDGVQKAIAQWTWYEKVWNGYFFLNKLISYYIMEWACFKSLKRAIWPVEKNKTLYSPVWMQH